MYIGIETKIRCSIRCTAQETEEERATVVPQHTFVIQLSFFTCITTMKGVSHYLVQI